jgi:hypothetical protein
LKTTDPVGIVCNTIAFLAAFLTLIAIIAVLAVLAGSQSIADDCETFGAFKQRDNIYECKLKSKTG